MKFLNIAAYTFVSIHPNTLTDLRTTLKEKAQSCQLKGTILLSTEGINIFLAGLASEIEIFQNFLKQFPMFNNLSYKESWSETQPFSRMLVRLKKEIISMGKPEIAPEKQQAPYLKPEQLKKWYEENHDMIILDTRNDYEVELGTFKNALNLNIDHFRHFPDAIAMLPSSMKNKPVVTFCTGGIRCEKAALYMMNQGFKEVYQLEGGILNYFEKCGGNHYEGECFVFDKRVALDTNLKETSTKQCYSCRGTLPLTKQSTDGICPHCHLETHA